MGKKKKFGWTSEARNRSKRIHKPKIRWHILGLADPKSACPDVNIEEIRRQVSDVAGRSSMKETRTSSDKKKKTPSSDSKNGKTQRHKSLE